MSENKCMTRKSKSIYAKKHLETLSQEELKKMIEFLHRRLRVLNIEMNNSKKRKRDINEKIAKVYDYLEDKFQTKETVMKKVKPIDLDDME